jgi:hypothetical protein
MHEESQTTLERGRWVNRSKDGKFISGHATRVEAEEAARKRSDRFGRLVDEAVARKDYPASPLERIK